MYREGIANITADDIAAAHELGYVVKLLGGRRRGRRSRSARACTRRWSRSTTRSRRVRGSYNAVFIEGEAVGQLMLLGRGAGGGPDRERGARRPDRRGQEPALGCARRDDRHAATRRAIRPIDETASQFYVSLDAADRPGVLAAIAGVFGKHEVSIQSMQQKGQGDEARLIFVTHLARESAMAATIREVRELDAVERVGSVLRVVGGEE